jgi:hypothetical protein
MSKEVKTEWSNSRKIWQNLLRKAVALRGVFANGGDDVYVLYTAHRI